MTVWLIEPRDPLIVRDGRPFGNNPGARAVSLPFPFPSTTTGAVRTRAGSDETGRFDKRKIEGIKTLPVRGPIMVDTGRGQEGGAQWLFPAPQDSLILQPQRTGDSIRLRRLAPISLPPGAVTDLTEGNEESWLVGLASASGGKPYKEPPFFWYWSQMAQWLLAPADRDLTKQSVQEMGVGTLSRSVRSHVRLTEKLTADDGALFQTVGLEFHQISSAEKDESQQPNDSARYQFPLQEIKPLEQAKDLALSVATDRELRDGVGTLGGERRLAHWQQSSAGWPQCPERIVSQIVADRACRLILATPALFDEGYRPAWILQESGVRATVKAAAVSRPTVVSGWDYEKKSPKPTRRLAPAGSVYFLKLEGSDSQIEQFVRDHWLQNVSDQEQDRFDGFGLALFGTWSGQPIQMEVE